MHWVGLSLNGNYSIVSFKNVNCDTYIFNVKLENTIQPSRTYNLKDYFYPEENNIIAYWPLASDFKPQILNPEYMIADNAFEFNSQAVTSDVIISKYSSPTRI